MIHFHIRKTRKNTSHIKRAHPLHKIIQMLPRLRSNNAKYLYLFIIIGTWFMSVCSYTSPLFYFDYSPDNNTFFTVGKGMMHGIIPYKDVFEQKGPYLYLMHGIAYLIDHNSLNGVFPFEVASLVCTMWFTYKLCHLFVKGYISGAVAIFTPILYLFHPYYDYGDTAESMLFPFTTYLIYIVVKYEKNHFKVPNYEWVIQGAIVGIIFLVKYTELGSWIIFYPFVFGLYLYHKRWNDILNQIKYSFYGFIGALLPWVIYFLTTQSFGAFLKVYFYDNIVEYSNSSAPIFSKLLESLTIYSQFLQSDTLICIVGLIAVFYVLSKNLIFTTFEGKALYILMNIGCAIFEVYGYQNGQVYQYYELAFFPYLIIPLAGIIIKLFTGSINFNITRRQRPEVIILMIIISFFILMGVNNNVLSSRLYPNNASVTKIKHPKSPQHPAQIDFGTIIRDSTGSHSTLLNYGSIDMGFYTASGIMPHNYYFQNYNFSEKKVPQIIRSQRNIIKHHKTEWVVLNTEYGDAINEWHGDPEQPHEISGGNLNSGTRVIAPYLLKNYKIVANHLQSFESMNVNYWLLKRRKHPLSRYDLTHYLKWNRKYEKDSVRPYNFKKLNRKRARKIRELEVKHKRRVNGTTLNYSRSIRWINDRNYYAHQNTPSTNYYQ